MKDSKPYSHWWTGLLISLSMIACKPEYMTKEELQNYVHDQDNDLSFAHEYKGYTIQVTFRPSDLLMLQESGDVVQLDSSSYQRLHNKYKDYYYFICSLSKENKEALYKMGGGQEQFSELVQVLSFRMGQYVNLTTSARDTIPVSDFVFPRTYGMGESTNLMFVFSREKAIGEEWLQFNLREFGMGLGNQNFRFRIRDLENTPKIKFKIT